MIKRTSSFQRNISLFKFHWSSYFETRTEPLLLHECGFLHRYTNGHYTTKGGRGRGREERRETERERLWPPLFIYIYIYIYTRNVLVFQGGRHRSGRDKTNGETGRRRGGEGGGSESWFECLRLSEQDPTSLLGHFQGSGCTGNVTKQFTSSACSLQPW